MENITDINQIKMAVLIKTAQYAFEGTLDEKQETYLMSLQTQLSLISDVVYTENEKLSRQRVRLAMGRIPSIFTMKSQIILRLFMLCRLLAKAVLLTDLQ